MHTVTMNPTADLPYHVDFQVGGGFPVTFTGMSKGTEASIGSGTYRYTPHLGLLGVDNLTATYQPTYGGGSNGGYNPPPITTTIPMSIVFPSYGSATDELYTNPDPATNTAYPTINYFVLKDNTLTITPDKGLLNNDTTAAFVPYLTAHQVGNGQYGIFDIHPDGGFTYTPYSSVFNSSFVGLTDTCEYYDSAPDGSSRPAGLVKVDLAELYIKREGLNVETNPTQLTSWVGEQIALSVGIKGKANLVGSDIQWCVTGDAIDNYIEVPEATGPNNTTIPGYNLVVPMSNDEFKQLSLDFYWWKNGSYTVCVSVLTPTNQDGYEDSGFTIKRPNRQLFAAKSSDVTIRQTGQGTAKVGLGTFDAIGKPINPEGMTFVQSSASGDPSSSYRFTQTVSITSRVTTDSGGVIREGIIALDKGIEYPAISGTGSNLNTDDSPHTRLQSYWKTQIETFMATMYMMFKSDRQNSIWVPLQEVKWTVGWTVDKDANGVWSITSQSFQGSLIVVDSDSYPKWKRIFEPGDNLIPF